MELRKTKCRVRWSEIVGMHVVHHVSSPRAYSNGEWNYEVEDRDVILMAVKGKWAMVRRFGANPYTCMVKELVHPNT